MENCRGVFNEKIVDENFKSNALMCVKSRLIENNPKKLYYIIDIQGPFKKYADCLNCAARVGFKRIRLVSLGSYRSAD